MKLGVVGTSRKENEHRLPLHPDHFDRIPDSLLRRIRFEAGYGVPFGVDDDELQGRFAGLLDRSTLLAESDVVLLPKPLPEDLAQMREGAVLWGWPHCVQQSEITQVAIDRRLTLIAWEAMFTWKGEVHEMHLFDRNNEMAGYCAVLHALELAGRDGFYGPRAHAAVLSHGSVSRGALYALLGRGFERTSVFTQRPPWTVHDKIPGCRYGQMLRGGSGDPPRVVEEDGSERPLLDALTEADLIVNGILQDTDRPLMFLQEGDESLFAPGTLIVDVSCDTAMGFPFARPTSFETPTFRAGPLTYYAVDHTPSYLWRSATWELSRVIVPHLATVMGGSEAWERDETIRRAIEIRDGRIENPKILSFQHRAEEYPHAVEPG